MKSERLLIELIEEIVLNTLQKQRPLAEFEAIEVAEAAKILGVSASAIYDLCKVPREETGFPFAQVTLGGKISIDKFEMIRWHKQGGLVNWRKEEEE